MDGKLAGGGSYLQYVVEQAKMCVQAYLLASIARDYGIPVPRLQQALAPPEQEEEQPPEADPSPAHNHWPLRGRLVEGCPRCETRGNFFFNDAAG